MISLSIFFLEKILYWEYNLTYRQVKTLFNNIIINTKK